MIRLLVVVVALAAIGFGASRLNRRIRPARPHPLTLAEKYGWEMALGDDTDAERARNAVDASLRRMGELPPERIVRP